MLHVFVMKLAIKEGHHFHIPPPNGLLHCIQQSFLFFGVRSYILAISFIQVCSPIILQFKPENSFDSVQIGVSNQSLNTGGVEIKCHKCFDMNYDHNLCQIRS